MGTAPVLTELQAEAQEGQQCSQGQQQQEAIAEKHYYLFYFLFMVSPLHGAPVLGTKAEVIAKQVSSVETRSVRGKPASTPSAPTGRLDALAGGWRPSACSAVSSGPQTRPREYSCQVGKRRPVHECSSDTNRERDSLET